jgi:RND superfamily putative drug exporter
VAHHRTAAALVLVVAVAALVAAALPVRRLSTGLNLLRDLPSDQPSARAAALASEGFAPGIIAPAEILLQDAGLAEKRPALDALQELIAREPGIAGVVGPAQQPAGTDLAIFVSKDGTAARYFVVLASAPYGATAMNDLERLQERLPSLLEEAGLGGAQARVAGDTAIASQLIDRAEQDLPRVSLTIVAIDLLILVAFLRSLVIPLLLLALSGAMAIASLGATTWLFQDILGHDSLVYYVPLASVILLLAFGSDYTLFVAGRVWEEAERLPVRAAIARAARSATPAVAIAGLMLALSFALLVIVPLDTFREFAFAISVGVLLNTFFIQAIVVPAAIAVFGSLSWWPLRPAAAWRARRH